MKTIDEMIEVMQAYRDGKPVERTPLGVAAWSAPVEPMWDWMHFDYRIAVTKPSIDWSHVAPKYRWMAVTHRGVGTLFTHEPFITDSGWDAAGRCAVSSCFASFTPGTCDWRDSLVERPT